jgi:hypothetical protein
MIKALLKLEIKGMYIVKKKKTKNLLAAQFTRECCFFFFFYLWSCCWLSTVTGCHCLYHGRLSYCISLVQEINKSWKLKYSLCQMHITYAISQTQKIINWTIVNWESPTFWLYRTICFREESKAFSHSSTDYPEIYQLRNNL